MIIIKFGRQTNNIMSKQIFFKFLFFSFLPLFAQIPDGYYDDAQGKSGYQLKTALKTIITNGHNDQGYDSLYTLYQTADSDSYYENDGTVLDMYSEKPAGADSYEYTHNSDKCGQYSTEGDCYNREHLMPQSVFDSQAPMKNDGHFVIPTDGYVNGRRSNYPFGEVNNPTWTSTNGSKLGANSTSGYSDTVFEPIDEFKGDIARMLFYFATRYEDNVASWTHDMLNGTSDQVFADWFLQLLLQWHANDPVSQKEIDRNDAVYDYQGNRNPFIDHPEWVDSIWNNNNNQDNNQDNNGNNTNAALIAIQDFEGTSPTWNYTLTDSGYNCFDILTNQQGNNTHSLRIKGTNKNNIDPYIELDNIDISGYNNVKLWVYFASQGPDSKDDLYLNISYDNGNTWNSTKLVDGNSNLNLNFGDTDASRTVSPNPYYVDISDNETQIKVKIVFDERSNKNNTSDYYFIDDIKLEGDSNSGGPNITNIQHNPNPVTPSDNVNVSANVTDSDGIYGVELHWGTTSGNLNNTIQMSNTSGDTYTTDDTIPAQSDGTTIYYEVYALDNNLDETTSPEQSYTVNNPPHIIISEVAGKGYNRDPDDEYIELINLESSDVNLDGWQLLYYEGSNLEKTITFDNTYIIQANDAFVVAVRTSHSSEINADYTPSSSFSINNNFYVILKDPQGNIHDQAGSSSDKFNDDYNYEFTDCNGDNLPVANWDNLGTGNGTPGAVNCHAPQPEISVEGNNTEIPDGDTTPSTADGTDFGNVEVNTTSQAQTFTIKNTGSLDLTVNAISSNNSEFVIGGTTSGTIAGGSSMDFTVTFAPNTTGTKTATITIDNDDADENPYTFTVTGTATGSQETDIVSNGNEATTVSSLINDVSITTTGEGIEVWQFTIRDGGSDLSDADDYATTVTAITFTQNSGNAMNDWGDAIQSAALFDGSNLISNTPDILSNKIQFTGLNFTVPDDSSKTLSLRISIQVSPNDSGSNNDGDDFVFQISQANVSADANGSQFDNFTAAQSTNGLNVFDVTATQLTFTQQPTNVGQGSTMTPSPQVSATDANANIDLDFENDISITSTGTMTNDPIVETATAGTSVYNNVIHTVVGTGFTLTASASGLSPVTSNPFDVLEQTLLAPGDLAILAVNTNTNNPNGCDEISFVCFKDITPGTKLYLTDNGYERKYADLWGSTEGVVSITRIGSTLPKGTIITFVSSKSSGNVTSGSDFDIYTCGSIDDNWDKDALSGTGIGGFNLNSDDDVWIMQGGTWTNVSDHQSTYDGTVLYGWTESGWDNTPPNGNDRGSEFSNLFNYTQCFTTTAPVGDGKVKFNDPNDPDFSTTDNDQLDWIALINDTDNWDTYSDNSDYNSSGFDYKGDTNCPQITIAVSTHIAGKWNGSKNSNWFDCSNWDNLTVPDETTNVTIPSSADNELVIDATADFSDIYTDVAKTNDLNINDYWIEIKNANDKLEIHGNLTIAASSLGIDMDGTTNTDGTITLYGNWINQGNETLFIEGESTVKLVGNTPQTVTCNNGNDTEKFYNLNIDNAAGVNFSGGNIHAAGILTLTQSPTLVVADSHYILADKGLVNNGVNIVVENEGSFVQTGADATITDNTPATYTLNKTSLPVNNYYDYVYWSSPLNSNTLTLGDIVPGAWRYYEYDNSFQPNATYPFWRFLNSTEAAQIGKGYAVSAPANNGTNNQITITAGFTKDNAPFNTGDITITLTKNGTDSGDAANYNLIGNPYPSAIDFDALYNDNTAALEGNYSLWTNCAGLDANGHHQAAGYSTYVVAGGNGTATSACSDDTKNAERYIATGQGFMVEAKADNASLILRNTHRVIGNNNGFLNRPATQNRDILWLDMFDNTGKYSQIAVGFYAGATDQYDSAYDANSMNTGSGFALYSVLNNQKLVIQGLARQQMENKTIPLGVELDAANQVTFHLNHTEGFDWLDIFIKDNNTNTLHDIKASDYTVNLNSGDTTGRFELVFAQTSGVGDNEATVNTLIITQNNDLFSLHFTGDKTINNIQVFDITGRLLFAKNDLKVKNYHLQLGHVPTGNVLFFKVLDEKGQIVIKKLIKQ